MGITSFLGMIICFATIVYGIIMLGGDLGNFLNGPSVMLVFVPTIGAMVATFPLSLLSKIPAHFKIMLSKGYQPEEYVDTVSDFARRARSEGLLSLQNARVNDPTMQYCINMIVDGVDETKIKDSLEDSLTGLGDRHYEAIGMYERAAAYAPAFGMCATVVSLVNMLMGLDFSDPAAINSLGANMATALITTLYGSMLANIVFLPIAGRLKLLHSREVFGKTIIYTGLLGVCRGDNPTFISNAMREQLSKAGKGGRQAAAGGGE